MPDIVYSILSVICALFIVAALFTDPATDEDIGYQFIGTLIFLPIIALAVAGFSFILPFLLSALGILALVSIGLALLFLLWKLLDTNVVRELFHELFKAIGNIFKFLWKAAKKIPRILKNLLQFLWELIKNPIVALRKFLGFLGKAFRGLWNVLKAIGRWLRLLLKSPFKALSLLWKALKKLFSGVAQFYKRLMKLPGIVGKFFRGIVKILGSMINVIGRILDTIEDMASTLARFIRGVLGYICDIILQIFSEVPWIRPILRLIAKLWLLLLLPFFFLFRSDNKKDDNKKNTIYVLPAKKVPTILQGVSDDLIDILNTTHKHIRRIKTTKTHSESLHNTL